MVYLLKTGRTNNNINKKENQTQCDDLAIAVTTKYIKIGKYIL